MNCSPIVAGKTVSEDTCMTRDILHKIKSEYNHTNRNNPIVSKDSKEILQHLRERLSCSKEDCWLNQIQDPWTRSFNYYDNYVTDIVIEVQDLKDQSRYGIKLFEAYPKSVGAVQLDYAGKDVMKIAVNFAYKYYHIGSKEVLEPPEVAPVYEYPAVQTAKDPLNSFVTRLKNFAIGAVGAKAISKLPQLIKR